MDRFKAAGVEVIADAGQTGRATTPEWASAIIRRFVGVDGFFRFDDGPQRGRRARAKANPSQGKYSSDRRNIPRGDELGFRKV